MTGPPTGVVNEYSLFMSTLQNKGKVINTTHVILPMNLLDPGSFSQVVLIPQHLGGRSLVQLVTHKSRHPFKNLHSLLAGSEVAVQMEILMTKWITAMAMNTISQPAQL